MSDLRLDLAAVTELGTTLTTVAGEFENANARSDRYAEAVGHDGLMTDNIKALADAAATVSQSFTDVDGQLATAIEGGGS